MKKIELGTKYKVLTIVIIALILILTGVLVFMAICMYNGIDIDMTQEEYYIVFGILAFLVVACIGLFFIHFHKCYYDEENEVIVVESYFKLKRRFVVDKRESYALVHLSKCRKDKCVVDLRHDGKFLLTIMLPKDTFEEELKKLRVKEIVVM